MNNVTLQAKSVEEAIRKAEEKLNASRTEFIYNIVEEKTSLLKGKTYTIKAVTYEQLTSDIEEFLKQIISPFNINLTTKALFKDGIINIDMSSQNNPILIGKNGQTLKALETILKQNIFNEYQQYLNVNLDVENYKEKRIANLERLAIKIAKEVRATKVETSLDNMNSYERRIIHNRLSNFKGVKTISEGEEPNRHIIIKPTD